MDRLDLYKELYFKELERKDSINNSLSLPIGIITGLIAWLFYFFNERYLPTLSHPSLWIEYIFYTSLATLITSIFFLLSSFFRPKFQKKLNFITSAYNYGYIPYPNQYETYYQNQLTENNENSTTASPISNKALEIRLIEDFSECTSHNLKLNEQKLARVSRSKFFLALCLLINLLLVFSLISTSVPISEKIENVKIIDTVKVTIQTFKNFEKESCDSLKFKP